MSDFGLMFYNARWYDPALGRFAQADTIIPEQSQGVQAWDRYAYTNNNPVLYNDPTGHSVDSGIPFPPNPFSYDTLTIGYRGLAKVIIGLEYDVKVNINWKAFKEGDWSNLDGSVNIGGSISGRPSIEGAQGLVVYGHDGSVLDQSEFQLIGSDGEIPVNAGGCIQDICGSALYTFDTNDADNLNGEGFFLGVGTPYGFDASGELIGGSDWTLYQKSGEELKVQIPFINREFLKTVPLLGEIFE